MKWSFFKSGETRQAHSFEELATDMHSHLIPGIDDGVKSMDESLYLIRKMYDMGFRKFITTPHIMNEFYKNTPEIILDGLEKLREAVATTGLSVTIEAAAEYLIDIDFENKYKSGRLMTFGDGYLLVELSYYNFPQNLMNIFFDLQIEGYKIILAHPERYAYWHANPRMYQDLKERNILFQLNTISLSGFYSAAVRDMAFRLIDKGMIDFAGSDMHNDTYLQGLEKSRFEPGLKKLMESGKLMNNII